MHITRPLIMPDALRISRYEKNPELGPRILFFSGGSALNDISRTLKSYTHNSIHLVTPYDSGGSSAVLRKAFDMPAIGDLRSRLMALADESVLSQPDINRLFSYRFGQEDNATLQNRLQRLIDGEDELTAAISNPMRAIICNHLGYFANAMPSNFDLQGASIGNLILCGGYLNNHRHLDPIIFLFSQLVSARGTVRAITEDNYHLVVELEDGEKIVGQHLFTGKETGPLQKRIDRLSLAETLETRRSTHSQLERASRRLIEQAELICFPPGSFYSSLMANLLPAGVGRAVHANRSPKVFIPNRGQDPEQWGMNLGSQIDTLLSYLKQDELADCPDNELINFILLDTRLPGIKEQIPYDRLEKSGIQVIDTPLTDHPDDTRYNSQLLVEALLSFT